MTYIQPDLVISPKQHWVLLDVLLDKGENSYSIVTFFDYDEKDKSTGWYVSFTNYTYGVYVQKGSSYVLSVIVGMIVPFLLIAFAAFPFFGEFNGVVLIEKFRNKINQTKLGNWFFIFKR